MRQPSGVWGPTVGLTLDFRKGQAQNSITLEKEAYNIDFF